MKWTKEKPTKPGWYWYADDDCGVIVVKINWILQFPGDEKELDIEWPEYEDNVPFLMEEANGEWSSEPIQEPEE